MAFTFAPMASRLLFPPINSKCDPVFLVPAVVAQDHWGAIDVFYHHIEITIVVEISKSGAATGLRRGQCRPNQRTHILKRAIVLIQEN